MIRALEGSPRLAGDRNRASVMRTVSGRSLERISRRMAETGTEVPVGGALRRRRMVEVRRALI